MQLSTSFDDLVGIVVGRTVWLLQKKSYSAFSKPQVGGNYASKAALARDVAKRRTSEFEYIFKGNTHYCSAESIVQYVSLAQALGLLTDEQKPFADMRKAILAGFKLTIADKIKEFAKQAGFDQDTLSETVRKMIKRNPAQVPSLRNIYEALQLKCGFGAFRRVVLMPTYESETKIKTGLRQVMLVPDILEG